MNDSLITITTVAVLALGLLAELNLLRVFLCDWRRQVVEDRERRRLRHRALPLPSPSALSRSSGACATLGAAIGVCSLAASPAFAQDPPGPAGPPGTAESTSREQPATGSPDATGPFSLQFNLDYASASFYHGIRQEDTGLILQPAAHLGVQWNF